MDNWQPTTQHQICYGPLHNPALLQMRTIVNSFRKSCPLSSLPVCHQDWLKILSSSSVPFSLDTGLLLPKILIVTLILVAVYFPPDVLTLRCLVPGIHLRLSHGNLVPSRVTLLVVA